MYSDESGILPSVRLGVRMHVVEEQLTEPTQISLLAPEASALDRSAISPECCSYYMKKVQTQHLCREYVA
jgi:hypothetical protein